MNNKVLCAVAFSLGAAIGSLVTYKAVAAKLAKDFEERVDQEVKAAKEFYSGKESESSDEEAEDDSEDEDRPDPRNEELDRYKKLTQNYINEEDNEPMYEPTVIPPDQFGELADYDTVSLTYYADGVLTDEADEPIEDVDDIIGIDSLNHFGEFEDDSVFVRNDAMKTDYEILRDSRMYSDVKNKGPHRAEGR